MADQTNTDVRARIGRNLRALREARKISAEELARELPKTVSANVIYRWERAEHIPRLSNLVQLADALAVDVSYFLRQETDPLPKAREIEELAQQIISIVRERPDAPQAPDERLERELEDAVRQAERSGSSSAEDERGRRARDR